MNRLYFGISKKSGLKYLIVPFRMNPCVLVGPAEVSARTRARPKSQWTALRSLFTGTLS